MSNTPNNLDLKQLFLDVNIKAIGYDTDFSQGLTDFTGKKTFEVGFFREGIGFGITDVSIETNTSLQPTVSITFKDLYGNTVFGNYHKKSNVVGKNLDFSALFAWPPPKFLFTFKGFLGKPVSWILNLKRTNTSYNTDGSYSIKCDFVPSHWGFFADMPFLYLLAVKKLKIDAGIVNLDEQKDAKSNSIISIFDIIKIGKKVQVKTKNITKEYDKLIKQLSLLKSSSVQGIISEEFKFGDVLTGSIQGRGPIQGFKPITITKPLGYPAEDREVIETLKASRTDVNISTWESKRILSLVKDGNSPINKETYYLKKPENLDTTEADTKIKDAITIIDENIKAVETEIKRRLIDDSKTEISLTTIKEVFSQIAGDAAFILGEILEAGEKGYADNKNIRDNTKGVIGKFFPLIDENGKQVPALSMGISKPGCEMDFVNNFIKAVSVGIAENNTEDDGGGEFGENFIPQRINNLEILSPNPYKDASVKQIKESILLRSGIAAYITRSYDPNKPGDFDNSTKWDNDSVKNIGELAALEMSNFTDSILINLSIKEIEDLRTFCQFFKNYFHPSGEGLLSTSGTLKDAEEFFPITIGSPNAALNTKVPLNRSGDDKREKNAGDFFKEFSGIFYTGKPFGSQSIDFETFTSTKIIHNGLIWFMPENGKYQYIQFSNTEDFTRVSNATNNPSGDSIDKENLKDGFFRKIDEPLGLIKLTSSFLSEEKTQGVLDVLNKSIKSKSVINYRSLLNFNSNSITSETLNDSVLVPENIQWTKSNVGSGIAYIVYSNPDNDNLVWGLFENDNRGRNQRVFLRTICEKLDDKLSTIEDEKANVLGNVLGKANSYTDMIYTQMHHIFHQWRILGYKDGVFRGSTTNKKLGEELEKEYSNSGSGDGFKFEFPMQTIRQSINPQDNKIKVENSIINIEPLYKPDSNTTILSMFQSLCSKNNFMFIPIAGNADYQDVNDIFKPYPTIVSPTLTNKFHVIFTPTPESRVVDNNNNPITLEFPVLQNTFEVKFGSPDNTIFKSIQASTDENKPTAESIANLQRLVDKDNTNKTVTTDCSMLSVLEGRSYTVNVDLIGNSQLSPMQLFILRNNPIFGGLYQVMKVSHSISPNNMTSKLSAIKMRFDSGTSTSVEPITIESLEALGKPSGEVSQPMVGGYSFADAINRQTIAQTNEVPFAPALAPQQINSGLSPVEYRTTPPFVGQIFTEPYKIENTSNNSQKVIIDNPFYYTNDGKKFNIANIPDNPQINENIIALQRFLILPLYENFKQPIFINSGYRNNKVNQLVGGVEVSNHTRGLACDMRIPTFPDNGVVEMYNWLIQNWKILKLPIKELICERGNSFWLHIAITDNFKFEERQKVFKIYDSNAKSKYVVQETASLKTIKTPFNGRFPGIYQDGTYFGSIA
jgi:hypothetical protein